MQIQILKANTNPKLQNANSQSKFSKQIQIQKYKCKFSKQIQILKGKMVVEISNLELLRMCWSILEAILSAAPIGIPYFATFLQTFNLWFQKFYFTQKSLFCKREINWKVVLQLFDDIRQGPRLSFSTNTERAMLDARWYAHP